MLLTPSELYDLVKIDNIYFQATDGGICFGGGEPTLYPEFIEEFCDLCNEKWKITIETSLRCSGETIRKLSKAIDYWIVDVKSLDSDTYSSYTRVSSMIEQHLTILKRCVTDKQATIKVPIIPGFNARQLPAAPCPAPRQIRPKPPSLQSEVPPQQFRHIDAPLQIRAYEDTARYAQAVSRGLRSPSA